MYSTEKMVRLHKSDAQNSLLRRILEKTVLLKVTTEDPHINQLNSNVCLFIRLDIWDMSLNF